MKNLIFLIGSLILLYSADAQNPVMKVDGMGGESARFRDKTELVGFVMEGSSQTSAGAGGLATGKRSYQPVSILKQTGTISPQLFQAFFTSKAIRELTIEYYKIDSKTGKDVLEYTLTFRNVVISGFKQFTGSAKNEKFTVAANNISYDEIKFSFQEIIMENKRVHSTVQDNITR